MPTEDFDLTSNSELKAEVRDMTDYTDTSLLSESQLDTNVRVAKRILATELGVTDFYNDRGVALALLGVTCIEAKSTVENDSTVSYDFGGGISVESRESDGDSLQVQRYENLIEKGMSESNVSRPQRVIGNTTSYIGS